MYPTVAPTDRPAAKATTFPELIGPLGPSLSASMMCWAHIGALHLTYTDTQKTCSASLPKLYPGDIQPCQCQAKLRDVNAIVK